MRMIYSTRAVKKGNSLFVIVPANVSKELRIRDGTMVDITVDNREAE